MATRIGISGGQVTCVYDDRFLPLLEALGTLQVTRATDVEFEDGEWVARLCSTGDVITRGLSRNEVITQEVKWLEDNNVPYRYRRHQVQES